MEVKAVYTTLVEMQNRAWTMQQITAFIPSPPACGFQLMKIKMLKTRVSTAPITSQGRYLPHLRLLLSIIEPIKGGLIASRMRPMNRMEPATAGVNIATSVRNSSANEFVRVTIRLKVKSAKE